MQSRRLRFRFTTRNRITLGGLRLEVMFAQAPPAVEEVFVRSAYLRGLGYRGRKLLVN